MHRAASAFVSGVEGSQELRHLGAPDLPHHQAVRTHAQRLTHKIPQRHPSGTFLVGGTRFQSHDMRVIGPKFRRVLGQHDAFPLTDSTQQA